MRIQHSRAQSADHFFDLLEPLARGYPVTLSMDDGKKILNPRFRGHKGPRLVLLSRGEFHGLQERSIVVSIIGKGSCILSPDSSSNVANLVLAGMPNYLARVLMNKIHQVFGETYYGNSTTPNRS